jgi:hypothetical protein
MRRHSMPVPWHDEPDNGDLAAQYSHASRDPLTNPLSMSGGGPSLLFAQCSETRILFSSQRMSDLRSARISRAGGVVAAQRARAMLEARAYQRESPYVLRSETGRPYWVTSIDHLHSEGWEPAAAPEALRDTLLT